MILIGSQAAKHWFPDFPRKIGDTDYISKEHLKSSREVEYHYGPAFDWLLERESGIASANVLYTIKLSHSFWNVHWDKTMFDILFFQSKGCTVVEEFYSLLYKDWEIRHGAKKVNLNTSNEQFFTKYVDREFVHDDIHKAVAYYDAPMYSRLKRDQAKAWIDKDMFFALSHEDRLRAVREEIYVIALERFLIPEKLQMNKMIAYKRAAKHLIISLSKGWFPRFIVENWQELKTLDPQHDFVKKFKDG